MQPAKRDVVWCACATPISTSRSAAAHGCWCSDSGPFDFRCGVIDLITWPEVTCRRARPEWRQHFTSRAANRVAAAVKPVDWYDGMHTRHPLANMTRAPDRLFCLIFELMMVATLLERGPFIYSYMTSRAVGIASSRNFTRVKSLVRPVSSRENNRCAKKHETVAIGRIVIAVLRFSSIFSVLVIPTCGKLIVGQLSGQLLAHCWNTLIDWLIDCKVYSQSKLRNAVENVKRGL